MDDYDGFTERLHTLLATPRAVLDLRRYYGADQPPGAAPAFTGARFEHLDGGGDRPEVADAVTAADLVAVGTLAVEVPSETALALLEGDLGPRLSALLARIPADLDLVDADPALLAPGSAADQAWNLLRAQKGMGFVRTHKLLARKRPRLLPVYDTVVRCALGAPESIWRSLRHALAADGRALHRRLQALHGAAGLPATVTPLRVCDVVLWSGHHAAHRDGDCG